MGKNREAWGLTGRKKPYRYWLLFVLAMPVFAVGQKMPGDGFVLNGIHADTRVRHFSMPQKQIPRKPQQFEHVLLYKNFRLFYTYFGENALTEKNRSDQNHNQIPDFAEDVLTEVVAAKLLLDSGGYDLLNDDQSLYRYLGVEYIDIYIANRKGKKSSAFFFGYRPKMVYQVLKKNRIPQGKSILMRVHQPGRRLKKSLPHELFHAYQISSTKLLNRWLVEGSAVWFENALSGGMGKEHALPKNLPQINTQITSKAYGASKFWNRLTRLCGSSPLLRIPAAIDPDARYIQAPGEKIFSDKKLNGFAFMLSYLKALGQADDQAWRDYKRRVVNLDPDFWTRSLRVAPQNNYYLLNTLWHIISAQCPAYGNNQELTDFVHLIQQTYPDGLAGLQQRRVNNLNLGWQAEGNQSTGMIQVVKDYERNQYVLKFQGRGIKSGYRFLKNQFYLLNHPLVRFQMKSQGKFALYFKVKTKKAVAQKGLNRLLIYHNYMHPRSLRGTSYSKYFLLPGRARTEPQWISVVRDLNRDLRQSEPDNQVLAIVDIFARGNGLLTPLKFFSPLSMQTFAPDFTLSFQTDKKCRKDTHFAKNIWDMHVYQGKIYIGMGNSRNRKPACNAGPLPVVVFDPQRQTFSQQYQTAVNVGKRHYPITPVYLKEEKIGRFASIQKKLMIPGNDPTQNWAWGNIYIHNNPGWTQLRTLKQVVHTYDLAYQNGLLFAAVGLRKNKKFVPGVAVSANMGKRWQNYVLPYHGSKAFTLFDIDDRLLVVTAFGKTGKISVSEFQDNHFEPRPQFNANNFLPDTRLNHAHLISINRKCKLDDRHFLFTAAYNGSAPQPRVSGLYLLSVRDKGKLWVQRLHPDLWSDKQAGNTQRVLDILCQYKDIYILSDQRIDGIYSVYVHHAEKQALLENKTDIWMQVLNFQSRNIVRSFVKDSQAFYFGVGIALDNANHYFSQSRLSDVGQLIRIKADTSTVFKY